MKIFFQLFYCFHVRTLLFMSAQPILVHLLAHFNGSHQNCQKSRIFAETLYFLSFEYFYRFFAPPRATRTLPEVGLRNDQEASKVQEAKRSRTSMFNGDRMATCGFLANIHDTKPGNFYLHFQKFHVTQPSE